MRQGTPMTESPDEARCTPATFTRVRVAGCWVLGESACPGRTPGGWGGRHLTPRTNRPSTSPAWLCTQRGGGGGGEGGGAAGRMQALVTALLLTADGFALNLTCFSSSLFHLLFLSVCERAFRAPPLSVRFLSSFLSCYANHSVISLTCTALPAIFCTYYVYNA